MAVIASGAVGIAASLALNPAGAATVGTVGNGSLELCSGAAGYAWGNTGGYEKIDCSVDGKGKTDGLTFSLNNSGDGKGGYGFTTSTARVSGYADGTLVNYGKTVEIRGTGPTTGNDAAVKVYGTAAFDSQVTMTGHKIVALADGDVSATSKQAINGSQLYAAQQTINGKLADAVRYDSSSHSKVTLGGAGSSTPVALTNVKAGALSGASTDAVNGAQLYATNQSVTNLAGDVTNINGKLADAVRYDSSAHSKVTLGGAGSSTPVALTNVKAGALSGASTDAVNGAQLYATNQSVTNLAGDVTNINGKLADAVRYDSSAHSKVTLGGAGSSTPVALTNVKAGALSGASTDAVNGAQLYATNQSVTNLAGDVTNIHGKLADTVVYDSPAHDTITLGGVGAASPVKLTNLQAGDLSASSTDAVTGAQLYALDKKVVGSSLHYFSVNSDIPGNFDNDGATGNHAIAIGPGASAPGYVGVAIGANTNAEEYGVAIGLDTAANVGVAIGAKAAATVWHDVAVGFGSQATGGSAIAVGGSSLASAYHATAIGPAANATGVSAVALGDNASAPANFSVAIGQNAVAADGLSIALGTNAKTAPTVATTEATIGDNHYAFAGVAPVGTLSIGDVGAERTLTNLAAGRLSADSTDAVNGSQLFSTIQETSANTTTINNLTYNITNGKIGLTLQDENTRDITVAKDTDGANVDFTGTSGERQLVGLANGMTDNAAVNVAQLASAGFLFDSTGKITNEAVTYVPGSIDAGSPHIALNPGVGDSAYFVDGDREKGLLPIGTRISNLADGVQDTDAANVGQVFNIVAAHMPGGGFQLLNAARPGSDADGGSGVDASGRTQAYQSAAYYSQVAGYGNNSGISAPTDVARAFGAGSIAIGSSAYTPAMNAVALGVQAYANAKDAVALGAGSVANQSNTVSVGSDGTGVFTAYDVDGNSYTAQSLANTRRIVNMAAGQADNDAVNVGQMRSVVSALGGGASINSAGVFVAPSYSVGGTVVNTVGDAIANLDNRVTQNTADLADLVGGGNAIHAGGSSNSVAQMSAVNRTVLAASDTNAAASAATDASAVHYDSDAHDQITLASATGGNVKLSGLENADLSAASRDAVTGQQLFATNLQVDALNQAVQNIATTGSTALSVNSANGPAAATNAQTIALGGGAAASGNNATAIGDSSVASGDSTVALGRNASATASNSVAIGANSVADRAGAVSVGSEGSERQITNVAAGTSGTDAVNLNQMSSALSQQSNTFNQQVQSLQRSINTVEKNAYAGVAAAMAMPNLTPSGPGKTVVAAGGGYYKGSSAAAVAVTYRSANMHWLANVGVAVTNNGDAGARAQVGYEF